MVYVVRVQVFELKVLSALALRRRGFKREPIESAIGKLWDDVINGITIHGSYSHTHTHTHTHTCPVILLPLNGHASPERAASLVF